MSTQPVSPAVSTVSTSISTAAPRLRRRAVWAGRILSGLVGVFLAFDLTMKLLQLPEAVRATAQLGFPDGSLIVLGVIQLVCLVLYFVPRTAVLGAVLWTGYLGGAIATHLRMGGPAFNFVFPILVAAMLWGGLWLRDGRLHGVFTARPLANRA
jgi:hypothetical protein